MTVELLSRERGAVISCNRCKDVSITTGQINVKLIRAYAKTQGWIRGLLKRSTGSAETGNGKKANASWDVCPTCAVLEKAAAAERRRKADERKAKRMEMAKLSWAEKYAARKQKAKDRRAAKRAAREQTKALVASGAISR